MKNNWFSITARENSPTAEIFIYDQIGKDWFTNDGITAKEFVDAIAPHKGRDLVVRINSPGGSVFDGLTIYNALKNHPGHVETRVEGLAASIASIIFLAGKERTMAESAMLMIHDPSGMVAGKADEMREMADLLDKLGGQLADIYAASSGKSKEEMTTAMKGEKWFTATEAKDWNLVDNVSAPLKMAASFDLKFSKVPTALQSKDADLQKQFEKVSAQLATEIENRITAELNQLVTENRMTVQAVKEWLPKCVADETILATLKKSPQNLPGSEPLGFTPDAKQKTINQDYDAYMARLKKFKAGIN